MEIPSELKNMGIEALEKLAISAVAAHLAEAIKKATPSEKNLSAAETALDITISKGSDIAGMMETLNYLRVLESTSVHSMICTIVEEDGERYSVKSLIIGSPLELMALDIIQRKRISKVIEDLRKGE